MSASGSETRVRKHSIAIRTTEDEKNAIRARANAHGMSVGAFVRLSTLSQALPPRKRFTSSQGQFVALVLSSLGMMASKLRELEEPARASDNEAQILIISGLQRELLFLRDKCFTALGRKP